MADNGVILRLVDVTEDSEVTLTTPKGVVRFKLADIPYGKIVEKLNGAIDLERTAATQSLTQTRTDDDFPAIAVAADGTAYVAQISFTPGIDRDERSRQWSKAPATFEFLAKPPGGDQLWVRTIRNGQAGRTDCGHGGPRRFVQDRVGDRWRRHGVGDLERERRVAKSGSARRL
jgi:hypothetical protein